MHDSKPASRFQLPRWAAYVIGAAVVLGLAAGAVVLLGVAETRRWERYAVKLRAGGDPLTFAEIEAQSSELPTERYAAQVLTGLAGQLPPTSQWEIDDGVLILGPSEHAGRDLFVGIPRYTLPPTRAFLGERAQLLDKIGAIGDMPPGRIVIIPNANPWLTVLPELAEIRAIVKLLYADGLVRLCDGDIDGSVEAVRLQARAIETRDQYPFLIGRFVQMALEGMMVELLEQVLRVATPTDRNIATLEECVRERLSSGTLRWALLGERATIVAIFNGLADGTISAKAVPFTVPAFLSEILVRKNQLRAVEMMTWLIDATDDFEEMKLAAPRVDQAVTALPATKSMAREMMSALTRATVIHARITARLRCAATALAAERFRMNRGRLPKSLGELVPDFLDSAFTDPFTGDPLLLATTEKGIVIYSVGENLFDDGGVVAHQKQKPYRPDVGFRLFKPEHRGVFLTDEPRPADD